MPAAASKLRHVSVAFFVLYALSLASSMAGMEFFGYGLVAIALGAVAARKLTVAKIGDGTELSLLIFSIAVAVGALLASGLPLKLRVDVVVQLRWILLLYALMTLFAQYPDWQKKFVELVMIFYIIVALYGVVQTFTGIDFIKPHDYDPDPYVGLKVWRARGFFSNTMSYSYCMGQCMAMAFAFLVTSSKPILQRRLLLGAFIIMAAALFGTFTRGAWVGAAAAVLAMSFLYNVRLGAKVMGVVTALVIVAAITSPTMRDRLAGIIHEKSGQVSVAQRYDLWRVNWEMFKDHPWFGVGYGYNYYFTPEYNLKVLGHQAFSAQTHNNFLQVLAGCGVFGFLAWIYFSGYFVLLSVKTFWQNRRRESWLRSFALGAFGAQIFFHIGGLTQSTFFDAKPTHILLCIWALLLAAISSRDSATDSPVAGLT